MSLYLAKPVRAPTALYRKSIVRPALTALMATAAQLTHAVAQVNASTQ